MQEGDILSVGQPIANNVQAQYQQTKASILQAQAMFTAK